MRRGAYSVPVQSDGVTLFDGGYPTTKVLPIFAKTDFVRVLGLGTPPMRTNEASTTSMAVEGCVDHVGGLGQGVVGSLWCARACCGRELPCRFRGFPVPFFF